MSLDVKAGTIKTVLKLIEEQSDFRFFYNSDLVDLDKEVAGSFSNKSIDEILNTVLSGTPVGYRVLENNFVVLSSAEILQQINVTGTVTDAAGETMPGVNISVKGTVTGTVTDLDGKYTINVPDGNTVLVYSFIGYAPQEITVGARRTIDVNLAEDTRQIEEVVVVGYGSQSRRNVTGSVTKISMKKLEGLASTNVSQALRGGVAGVQFTDNGRPGQGGSILVRGRRSITASNNPLIVVDGMFYNGSLNDINQNDIESMEVLKDASAAAIYGSRAANGVILITSKKGMSEKPVIRFNAYAGVSGWGHKMKLLSPERYVERKNDYWKAMGQEGPQLSASEKANFDAGKTVDPWDVISQDAIQQSYDISVSGKTDRVNYFISGAMNKDRGVILNDKSDRLSFRANLETKITDWLNIGMTAQFSRRNTSGVVASTTSAFFLSPYGNIYDKDGRLLSRPTDDSQAFYAPPVFDSEIAKNEVIQDNLFSNFYALVNIPFVEGLTYRLNFSPNLRWYHAYNATPNWNDAYTVQQASASKNYQNNYDWSLEHIVNYTRRFGTDHRIDATVMYGRSSRAYETATATGLEFTNDVLGWDNLSLAGSETAQSSSSYRDDVSYMARVNYGFKDRYLLTLTARRDGSSVFGANNKYATFPSAALAWIVSEESFLNSVKAIDMLKLRVSYGTVGNQAIDPYQSLTDTDNSSYVYGDGGSVSTGIFPKSMANASLKWEVSKTMNFAVDFLLLKGRIGGTVEFYNTNTDDLLLTRAIPSMNGFNSVMANIGATNNRGVEVTLNTVNVRAGQFEWLSDVTFSTNRNKIVHLYRSDINADGKEDDDIGNRWFIGQPVSINFDYATNGVWQEGDNIPEGAKAGDYRMLDWNKDGEITADDRYVLSEKDPKYRWSFNNTFRYGNWSLSVMVNSLLGWETDFYYASIYRGSHQAIFPERAMGSIDMGWWTPENRSNDMPSLTYKNPLAAGYYVSRNFVRIQDISLSYEFPQSFISKLKMSSLRFYVSGKNLYTFTKFPGFDPENFSAGEVGYPMSRIMVAGLNISF